MFLTAIGAVAGVSLALAGAAVGGVDELVVGGGIIGETISKNKQLQGASKHLQADYFHSMQLRILIGRAANNEDFAKKLTCQVHDAAGMLFFTRIICKICNYIYSSGKSHRSWCC